MIRTTMTMLALGFLTVSGASAMAATKTVHHQAKTAIVAQAEGAAPSGDAAKPAKEKKVHKAKGGSAGSKVKDKAAGGEAPSAPAPETPQK